MKGYFKNGVACAKTHGMSTSRVYKIWCKVKERCTNQNYRWYSDYGGRGITMCKEWRHSFAKFFADMGECPKGLSIHRKNNDGNYEPGNCIWATGLEQGRHKRNNVILTHAGISKTLSDWSRDTGIKLGTLWKRIKLGWDHSRIVTTPTRGTANANQ